MVAPWEECSGAKINYTGQRDLGTALTTGIAGGNLPDVAGLPGPGLMQTWYEEGALKPLDFVDFAAYEGATPAGFAASGKAPDGKLVGIFIKGAVKGLIWYNTATGHGGAPATWDELTATARAAATGDTKQWCIGVESGGDSGWPGTDWIEDIVLRQAGPDVYDGWVAGTHEMDRSPEIKSALETFGDAVANATAAPNVIIDHTSARPRTRCSPLRPAACSTTRPASSPTSSRTRRGAADRLRLLPLPRHRRGVRRERSPAAVTCSGCSTTPRRPASLIQYLLTPEAQQIWVERGGFISANKNVPLDAYPDEASASAQPRSWPTPKTFRFDASDLMPNAMNKAFFQAVVEYVGNPGNLDAILANLDAVQADAYSQ